MRKKGEKKKSGSDLEIQLTLSQGCGIFLVAGARLLTVIKPGLNCSLVSCRHPWSLEERNHFRLISTKNRGWRKQGYSKYWFQGKGLPCSMYSLTFITLTLYILLTIRTPCSKWTPINNCLCLLRSCTRSIFTVFQLPTGTGAAIWELQSFSDRTIRSAAEALWLRAGKLS